MLEPFRLGLIAGLMVALTAAFLGCGPAAPTYDEPAPIHVSQIAGTQTGVPEPPPKPAGSPALLDQKAVEPLVLAHQTGLPEAEPTAPSPALREVSAGQRDEVVVEPALSKVGGLDAAGNSARRHPAQERPYTWSDGDRTMTVLLQPDLVETERGTIDKRDDAVAEAVRSARSDRSARADTVSAADSSSLPVFRSQSGALMTLPGGVLLALDKDWGSAETDAFFERNGIEPDRVSEMAYIANGFFVETEPGFPSLDLANSLATLDGVRTSMPNWRQELEAQ